MFKFRFVILTVFVVIFALIIGACERKGILSDNERPIVEITSYGGVSPEEYEEDGCPDSASFQQKIYWSGYDPDGAVEGYAFRVTDEFGKHLTDDDGVAIGVPGYSFVDENGWVYHYQDGADESIPLEESEAKTIWTNQVCAVINFPANVNGDSITTTSIFEIKCIDSDGTDSDIVKKYYSANSMTPTCNVSSSKGEVNGKEVGTGIIFTFNILDEDQFIEGDKADRFEFMFELLDQDGVAIVDDSLNNYGYNKWWSTADNSDIHNYFVCLNNYDYTKPAFIINRADQDSTRLIAKAVDLSGIVSEPDTITFFVKEGFYPSTLIYNGKTQAGHSNTNDILVLGDNHFRTYNPLGEIIPSTLTPEGYHYSSPFWVDTDGNYTCIHSENLRIYLHWGYNGEYEDNSPNMKKLGIVYDEETTKNYLTEIKYFDLRLDGEPLYYAPLPANEYNYLDEETGKEWLRVPTNKDISQEVMLTGLDSGTHRFEVRAVDLQNKADETPSNFIFITELPIPDDEKEGILILDDTPGNEDLSPEEYVDSLYSDIGYFSNYSGTVDVLDRIELQNTVWNNINMPNRKDVFSLTNLLQYKTVIYFSDSPAAISNFSSEYDVLSLYLRSGGNLIFSAGANLNGITHDFISPFDIYFGLQTDEEDDAIVAFEEGWMNRRYFINAKTYNQDIYDDISVLNPHFNSSVNEHPDMYVSDTTCAIAPVAYFTKDLLDESAEILYTFGCRPIGDDNTESTEFEYNFLTEQPVAIKKETSGSKCYLFGFPLSYMDPVEVKTMLMQIINEIEE